MSIELASDEAVTRLTLSSRVRLGELAELHAAATAAAEAPHDVEVDLSTAEYLHVGAIQLLLSLHTTLTRSNRTLRVAAASQEVRDAFVRFGLAAWMENL